MNKPISTLLNELIAAGIWPRDSKTAQAQNLRSLVPPELVRQFAAEEDQIFLSPPPFRTIAAEIASASAVVIDGFWNKFGDLHQIIPEKALIIGDFGLGSDAPIILNYARNASDPPVFRLRYNADGHTEWVEGAKNFAEFAAMLGLAGETNSLGKKAIPKTAAPPASSARPPAPHPPSP